MATKNGTNGNDTINGTVFRDTLSGLGGNDLLRGRDADDTLLGGNGADELDGEDGDDELHGGGNSSGQDILIGDTGDDTLFGDEGNDFLHGGSGSGTVIFEMRGKDSMQGGAGADTIVFSWEDSQVQGGEGDDMLLLAPEKRPDTFESQLDLIQGGADTDTLAVYDSLNSERMDQTLEADLSTGRVRIFYDPNWGVDTDNITFWDTEVAGVENLSGGAFADELKGDENDNVLTGKGGGDTLLGRDGKDTLIDNLSIAARNMTATNVADTMDGGGGDDVISSTGGADDISGGSGDDTIKVLTYSTLTVDGGSGYDTIQSFFTIADPTLLVGANGSITHVERLKLDGPGNNNVTLAAPMLNASDDGTFTVNGDAQKDTIDGSRGASETALFLNGFKGDDTLTGGDGTDTLDGGADNDTLFYSSGNDTLKGGKGVDTVDFAAAPEAAVIGNTASVVASLATGEATIGLSVANTTLVGIENLKGSAFRDLLTGSEGDNTLMGAGGNDVLAGLNGENKLRGGTGDDTLSAGSTAAADVFDGGGGSDTVDLSGMPGGVTVDLLLTGKQNTGFGQDTFTGIENLVGSSSADTFSGNRSANSLDGAGGDDVLSGAGGADSLTGGAGHDTLTGGGKRDTFFYAEVSDSAAGSGADTITDFVTGTDKIDLSDLYAALGLTFAFIGDNAADPGIFGQVSAVTANTSDTLIRINVTGDDTPDFEILLLGVNFASVTAADFIV